MNVTQQLNEMIAPKHMLKHPFYQAWMNGELSLPKLQHYAAQYFPHVSAFPRFVSAIHSQCEDADSRKSLYQNLSEEEGNGGTEDHPELWLRFAEGLGTTRLAVKHASIGEKSQALVDTYFNLSRASYAQGLGALLAYESQVPEVAETKIEGLKKFYGIETPEALAFFQVHLEADRYHAESCLTLLEKLSPAERDQAFAAAKIATEALWDFLTEVHAAA